MSVNPRIAALRERTGSSAPARAGSGRRWYETISLVLVSAVVSAGVVLVYEAKNQTKSPSLVEVEQSLKDKRLLDINAAKGPGDIAPFLDIFVNEKESTFSDADRDFAAQKISDFVAKEGPLPNVGALSRIRVDDKEIAAAGRLSYYPQRLQSVQDAARAAGQPVPNRISLLRSAQIEKLKPFLVVRTPSEFRHQLLLYFALYLVGFYLVNGAWWLRRFQGDTVILPLLHLLTGIGFLMMVSLRDPVRDLMLFPVFTYGVVGGCAFIFLLSLRDYQRSEMRRLSLVPLFISFGLSILLILFGTGPGSEAKVNLFGFQPLELIRRLIVLFLAGYFAQNWEVLRELKENRSRFATALRRLNIPRLEYLVPVVAGVAVVMVFFYFQHDLGPAMIMFCTFLVLYGAARRRAGMAVFGLLLLLAGFVISYWAGNPKTVVTRIEMWRSPWNNAVRGGDQLARSFWAFASGGVWGRGLGLGDPGDDQGILPAAHTDLIVASVGEELGFLGVLAVFMLYAVLIYRCIRIALHAPGVYTFFIALGLTMTSAFQILLITSGILGLMPLSGVVSPFLSYGRTEMMASFAALGIILSISAHPGAPETTKSFRKPVKVVGAIIGILAVAILAKAAYVGAYKSDEIIVRKPMVALAARDEAGNPKTGYLTNPRLLHIAADIPRGSILDRNQIPLETGDRRELEAHRAAYSQLGVSIDQLSPGRDGRFRPFGASTYHLLEYLDDYHDQMRGFSDYAELVPLLRDRYRVPETEYVRNFYERDRSVRLAIDIRLQTRIAAILENKLRREGRQQGSIVVIDPATGELLASVSYPWPGVETSASKKGKPADNRQPTESPTLDNARTGRYPPGSTFKLVTALAALRKDPGLINRVFPCRSLGEGDVGAVVGAREIHDFRGDPPHGDVKMEKGLIVSCNAYFAQLGVEGVGPEYLFDTASQLGIEVAKPNTPDRLARFLADAAYGQGEVVVSPLEMARVAGTIANDGVLAPYVAVTNDSTHQKKAPLTILDRRDLVERLGYFMREVATTGTAKALQDTSIAGKTGTAETGGRQETHAWFAGFAPFGAKAEKRVAFAILVVHGGVGAAVAAPVARDVVDACRALNLIR